jgi:hypothetical protein
MTSGEKEGEFHPSDLTFASKLQEHMEENKTKDGLWISGIHLGSPFTGGQRKQLSLVGML